VPDFYQGTELWDFSLVDPDNRRPVDYERRAALLEELNAAGAGDEGRRALFERLAGSPADDRLKLLVTTGLLQFRARRAELFQFGAYEPLAFEGQRRDHGFGFARRHQGRTVLVIVPRLVAGLLPDAHVPPLGERVWGDTRVAVPDTGARCYRHALSGECVPVVGAGDGAALRMAEVFAHAPVALLDAQ
jgi:(1->4)-alpha-D-glucan 1-alpha-D-glucosylmutase